MKDLKIYSVDETPKPLLLRLACNGNGGAMLLVVNNEGDLLTGGRLLTLGASGSVYLHKKVDKALELPLDDKGRLKLVDYEEKSAVTFSDNEVRAVHRILDRLKSALRTVSNSSDKEELFLEKDVFTKITRALGYNFR